MTVLEYGNDIIVIDGMKNDITSPEFLSIYLSDRHTGVGSEGVAIIDKSDIADFKMHMYNQDGSEGRIAGNNIRCVGKYLYDKGYVRSEFMTIETGAGVHQLRLFLRDGKVSTVSVDMGTAQLETAAIPASVDVPAMIGYPLEVGGETYPVTCVSIGNPHCVIFRDNIDALDLEKIGPMFEYADCFPERVNTEFVRVVNKTTIRMRVWERGNGETLACGTGACAAVIAAVENGKCAKGTDITVKLLGGDLTVNYTDDHVILSGSAVMVYEGEFEY